MRWNQKSKTSQSSSFEQLRDFTTALFRPEDLVEIRVIGRRGKPPSKDKVVWRTWKRPADLLLLHDRMLRNNRAGANVYLGVNPRSSRSGTKNAVHLVRTLWADLDDVTPEVVRRRLEHKRIPEPSITVSSGHGVHLYWLLDQEEAVSDPKARNEFENRLRNLYRDLQSDSTQDVSRMLRLPGFDNVKQSAVPCEIIACDASRTYSIEAFDRWLPGESLLPKEIADRFSRGSESDTPPENVPWDLRKFDLSCDSDDVVNIRRLLSRLDRPVTDRSRRDFAIVCELLRQSVPPDEVRKLVEGHSKFTSPAYTESTIANAVRIVFGS